PLPVGVVALVLEPDRDPVVGEGPEVLAERVVELPLPLAGQEGDDLVATGDELVAIAPDRVGRVGESDPLRVAGVPGVLGGLHLDAGGFSGERRDGRPGHYGTIFLAGTATVLGEGTRREPG